MYLYQNSHAPTTSHHPFTNTHAQHCLLVNPDPNPTSPNLATSEQHYNTAEASVVLNMLIKGNSEDSFSMKKLYKNETVLTFIII